MRKLKLNKTALKTYSYWTCHQNDLMISIRDALVFIFCIGNSYKLIQWADSEHKNENRYLNVLAALPLRKSAHAPCTRHHVCSQMFQNKIILYKWLKRINIWINVQNKTIFGMECITYNIQYEYENVWKHEMMRNVAILAGPIQWMNEWMQYNATFKLKIWIKFDRKMVLNRKRSPTRGNETKTKQENRKEKDYEWVFFFCFFGRHMEEMK